MFRLFSTYVSTELDLCFDCARPMFRLCSTYVSTELDLTFDCARPMFRLCSTYVSTELDLCFDCARPMFRLCSTYVSNVLDRCFFTQFGQYFVCFNQNCRQAKYRSKSEIGNTELIRLLKQEISFWHQTL